MLKCNDCHYFNSDCPYKDYKINNTESQIACSYYIDEKEFVSKLDTYENKYKIGQ